jgi:hypothetical protein
MFADAMLIGLSQLKKKNHYISSTKFVFQDICLLTNYPCIAILNAKLAFIQCSYLVFSISQGKLKPLLLSQPNFNQKRSWCDKAIGV